MKRILILLFSILFSIHVFGQKTEFSLDLGSGFFSFSGSGAQKSTYYIERSHTNNPYGKKSSFSYGISLQAQRVTKAHFIYGIQAGYESLSSKIKINNIYPPDYNPYSMAAYTEYGLAGSGSRTILTNEFFTLHPFVGYRMFIISSIKTDLTFGADLAFCLNSEEKATVNSSYGSFNTKVKRDKPEPDSRLRVDLTNFYKHFGLTVGYSYGLTNYQSGLVGASSKVYSQMLRLGLIFKL